MSKLILNSFTSKQIEAFLKNPTHALGIVGERGSGKFAVASLIVNKTLNTNSMELTENQFIKIFGSEGGSISIELIRELNEFLKLKTTGPGDLRRFIIIEHAGNLTIEAQNALLKTLEEPPLDTLIILTLEGEHSVLPTISSRLRLLKPALPTKKELKSSMSNTSNEEFEQAYNLSGGLPGLMDAIINSDNEHPLFQAVNTAKKILQTKTFERLIWIDDLSKQKEDVFFLLDALKRISDISLRRYSIKNDYKLALRWKNILQSVYDSEIALINGAGTKLVLTNLILSI